MGTVTDPIADMLTRIRNANAAGHDEVRVPASKLKAEIARILKEEGFIQDWTWIQDSPQGTLRIVLKYGPKRERVLRGIRRVSKPGLRVYVRRPEIPRVRGGLGVAILSTSRGILTDRQARRLGVGGEVLCYVW
ncbi:MAG: 30S ribosomal protein S8 [Armatimonadota bacterium]|nr:30S ribosomal protein S8 [Armatimonadota bacterium]MDW8156771.1 30S ribosomal protein S8 [Armatimonadota bacterium]